MESTPGAEIMMWTELGTNSEAVVLEVNVPESTFSPCGKRYFPCRS